VLNYNLPEFPGTKPKNHFVFDGKLQRMIHITLSQNDPSKIPINDRRLEQYTTHYPQYVLQNNDSEYALSKDDAIRLSIRA
jgi:hypothetical protein